MSGRRRGRHRLRRSWLVAIAALVAAAAIVVTVQLALSGGGPASTTARDSSSGGETPVVATSPSPSAAAAAPRGRLPQAGARRGQAADRIPPMRPSEPARVVIPAIGVDAGVMDLSLMEDGTLGVPPGGFPAGWYVGSPTPGELGPAIVAGHVHFDGAAGVFERLAELVPGDRVLMPREDGSVARFTVSRTERYAKDAFPTTTVYGDIDHAGLRLITCGGLDEETGVYEDNVVVYAELTGAP